jgi:hypothetical protein
MSVRFEWQSSGRRHVKGCSGQRRAAPHHRLVSSVNAAFTTYAGTWIGQFVVKYEWRSEFDKPWQKATRSFNITLKLARIAPVALGTEMLRVTSVKVSDSFFGTIFAVRPQAALSVALLPVPPRNISNRAGQGLTIFFPNGSSLQTANAKGELHVSSDGGLMSNALVAGRNTYWIALNNVAQPYDIRLKGDVGNRRNLKYTWSLSKSAL